MNWKGPFFVACLACIQAVYAADWRFDANTSQLKFIPSFEGADAPGRFERFEVIMDFDPANPTTGSLKVVVDVTSADMDSHDINLAIAEPEWFGFSAFPEAIFTSTGIRGDNGQYAASGILKLKGLEQAVKVPFHWQSDGTTARMEGSLDLDRMLFGIGTGEWSDDGPIAHRVRVSFKVTLHVQ
jgi:polyisoprenoid-binding protein YceI